MGTQCCHGSPTRKAVSLLSISPAFTSIFTCYPAYHSGSILFLSKVNPFHFLISSHGFHSYIGQVNLLSPISLPMAHKHILEPYYLLKISSWPHILIQPFLNFFAPFTAKLLMLSMCAVSFLTFPFTLQPILVMSTSLIHQHESSQGY